jgi:hypothetical protein
MLEARFMIAYDDSVQDEKLDSTSKFESSLVLTDWPEYVQQLLQEKVASRKLTPTKAFSQRRNFR